MEGEGSLDLEGALPGKGPPFLNTFNPPLQYPTTLLQFLMDSSYSYSFIYSFTLIITFYNIFIYLVIVFRD